MVPGYRTKEIKTTTQKKKIKLAKMKTRIVLKIWDRFFLSIFSQVIKK